MAFIPSVKDLGNVKEWEPFQRMASQLMSAIAGTVNGGLDMDKNINAQFIDVKFLNANTDTPVLHTLERVAENYIMVKADGAFVVYTGSTPAIKNVLYLKANASNVNATIMVF